MKKIIENRIFIIIITMIICISGTMYAATTYKASEISYTPSSGSATNVESALNELYTKVGNSGKIQEWIGYYVYSGNYLQYFKQDTDGKFYYLNTGSGQDWSTTHMYVYGNTIKTKTAGKFYICYTVTGGNKACETVTATAEQNIFTVSNQGVGFAFYVS